ncbi:glycosyl hydrolase family 38 protein [Ancylostoma caninum]|uniref:Glycosyl hydrolase family 38 protein n=1 Tax=Ancylostoma caninum TaxID=29170 RepID=A0A368G3M0_ANCCA|nr:glycosyl hydrolase family 38 protein [Ancylostoma caninum]
MFLRYGRRRGQLILVLVLTLFTTAFFVYTIGIQVLSQVIKESTRSSGLEKVVKIKVQQEVAFSLTKGACEAFPHNNTAAEFDMFNVYHDLPQNMKPEKSGNNRRPSTEKLKVFVLPFTHVDPGWLKTFDSYSEDTDSILDNMHRFMVSNPNMTFMWAELVFFEKWWAKQNSSVRDDVRRLVSSGRLEMVSGSWVMTDEANVYYPVTVDNIVEGHQFLKQEFGISPTVVWSNDPFGYSNSIQYLFTQAGTPLFLTN